MIILAKGATIRMRQRTVIVLLLLVVCGFAMLIFRLAKLQLFDGEKLQKMAMEQQLADTKISAQRGTIYDCNMKPLAQSATVWTVVLEPAYLDTDKNRELVCDGLHEILGIDKEKLTELSKKKSFYTIIKKKVESDVKDKIMEFKTQNKISSGIRLIEDYKRYYPYGSFASAVLGFTGADGQGLAGLEAYYDSELRGEAGRVVTAKNAIGTDMPFDYEQMMPAKNGNSLKLCIDEAVQHFVEKNLEEGIINNKIINRAAGIVMDVNTGEILAMAVKEDFDPNEPFKIVNEEVAKQIEALPEEERAKARSEALSKQWRNKAVSDTYYPGSVWKMVTTSMGLEEKVVDENTTFTCSGAIRPYEGAQLIHCHKHSGHGTQTFVEAVCNSCNPAFIMLGQKIGATKFYEYYKAFGFSEKTGIDLPGEAKDIFFSADGSMTKLDLAVASFGQNFSITPIQMLTAASAIANGGKLVQPHLVKEVLDCDGNIVKSIEPKVKRNVISEDTARRVTDILYRNATTGAARNAYVPGYRVCGKTGTSEKIGCSREGRKDYISSFCGYAPAENPKVAALFYFDTPDGDVYYGSAVAAPVFAKAMQDILPYLGIEKRYTEEELSKLDSSVPSMIGKKVYEARDAVQNSGLNSIVMGKGDTIISQIPEPSAHIPKGGTVVLYTDSESKQSVVKVPKLTELSIYNVNKAAAMANLNIKISGTDLNGQDVVSVTQSIPEGTEVKPGTVITVNFIHKGQNTTD